MWVILLYCDIFYMAGAWRWDSKVLPLDFKEFCRNIVHPLGFSVWPHYSDYYWLHVFFSGNLQKKFDPESMLSRRSGPQKQICGGG